MTAAPRNYGTTSPWSSTMEISLLRFCIHVLVSTFRSLRPNHLAFSISLFPFISSAIPGLHAILALPVLSEAGAKNILNWSDRLALHNLAHYGNAISP